MPAPADSPAAPDTIVLIHGFWVTPRSWERWIPYYEAKGYRVLAPAYPGLEVEVEALNRDPSPIERLTVPQIVDRLEQVVRGLDAPPILMGHSAGGVFVQVLLDRGLGAAGVVIDSAPTEGVLVTPLSQLRSLFPVLKNPANRHKAVGLTFEQWRYAFTNTFSEAESRALYERYHVPASGAIVWDEALANFIPGPQDVHVNYHNDARAPLLFISGAEDHLMPPSVQRSNARHYRTRTRTEVKEFPGRSHLMPAQAGWEEVADYALDWAVRHAAADARRAQTEQPVRGGSEQGGSSMKVRDAMTLDPVCCVTTDSAQKVAGILYKQGIGSIPVVSDLQSRKLVGMITDRDLCCSVVANGLSAQNTPIEKFTSRNPATCRESDTLDDCERLMQERQVRRIPIVDDDLRVIGIVSQADLALKEKPEKVAKTVAAVSKPQSSAPVAVA